MVEGVEVPVIESIFDSSVCTLSVILTSLPVAPVATNVIGVPLTVIVSPAAKPGFSEFVPEPPDSSAVAPVIAVGGVAWLLTTLPVATLAVLKKLSPAATADAATSVVPASVPIALFNAVFRLPAVAVGSVPIVKLPVGAGVVVVAVN